MMRSGIAFALALIACNGDGCGGEETGWDPSQGEACLSCHDGVEQAHPEFGPGECVACHGGDGTALTIEEAHVAVPADYWEIRGELNAGQVAEGFIKDMPPDMLDALDPAYLQFINPGDIRVADQTCGECHPDHVAGVRNSVMTTNVGHYAPTRYYAGLQDREPLIASYGATDLDYTGEEGTVESLTALRAPKEDVIQAAVDAAHAGDLGPIEQVAYDHYLSKNCNTCHAAGYSKNNSKSLYRSTGCSACHMLYNDGGTYEGDDQAIPNYPVYPKLHQLTTAIPAEQCGTCHFQGGRIGLMFRGIREGGFSDTPPNAEPWNEGAYGHQGAYYFSDEDTTNDYDETPPDVHYAAGMQCGDCHVGTDVHGTGRIHTTSKEQVDITCEDCHGTIREPVTPDADGVFHTSGGRALTQLYQNAQGEVALTGIVSGEEHVATQVAEKLAASGEGSYMHQGMGEDEDGWSHTDSMTCDTCHNSWQLQCLGCHVGMDLRVDQVDYQSGTKTPGFTSGSREMYSLDTVVLCENTEGRAQSCNSSQQAQLTVRGEDGEVLFGTEEAGFFRQNDDYDVVIGWSPFFQHTTSTAPRGCDTCHRTSDSDAEWERVRGVYGHGTGEFMLDDPEGDPVDALRFLDVDGHQITDFYHPNTGPLSAEVRERALGVDLSAP